MAPIQAQAGSNGSNGSNDSTEYDFDLFTIGAGSGGVRASRLAASQHGVRVAVAELPFNPISSDSQGGAGGTCVLRGCVPKKLFVYGSAFNDDFNDAKGFGWQFNGDITHNWELFLSKKNAELKRLNGVYMKMLDNAGVTFIEGRGKVVDAHTVEVAGKKYTAKTILVAVGGRAVVPPFEGHELAITSDNALELPAAPKRLAIIGSGYIALEFAGIYNNFGSEVDVFLRSPLPLKGFDQEVREFVTEQYKVNGLNLHPGFSPTKIAKNDDGSLTLTTESKEGEKIEKVVDVVLAATGRKANTKNLGLEEAGVKLAESGAIEVDEFSRTSVPSIYAVGDVTDRLNLTPVALMEGTAFVKTAFGGEPTKPDHQFIASAVFSQPPIATVGYTEEAAVDKFKDIDVYTSSFKPMKNTISGNENRTFMKVLVDVASDKVIGIHMVGPDCAEIMQGLAVAVKIGVTKKQLDSVVGIHPSAAEEFVTLRTVARQIRHKEVAKEGVSTEKA